VPRTSRLAALLLVGLLVGLLGAVLLPSTATAEQRQRDPIGSDPWHLGQIYRGDFPDPTVLRVGSTYYAYATTTANLNLPVLTSAGLRNWRPVSAGATTDAMPAVASWAQWHLSQNGVRRVGTTWAPSVARLRGRYVAAYATRKAGTSGKMCISVAVATRPQGPFVDHTTKPLVCPRRRGAIDPQIYKEKGKVWLLYKTEDVSIGKPTRIWIRRLGPRGLGFTPRSEPVRLLRAKMAWENGVIENPSMIRYRGVHYLFYSGNGWGSPHYSVGYAICKTVKGPCERPIDPRTATRSSTGAVQSGPLLASGGGINGPGGGFAFRGPTGGLRLAYHAWDRGFSRYPTSRSCLTTPKGCAQRKLHVAKLGVRKNGLLLVNDLGLVTG
jgi:GH43 family beta-xylosidase